MNRNSILLTGLTICIFLISVPCTQAEDNFESRFWDYLIGNNYKQWSPAPGKQAELYTGQVPHGTLLKIYVNRTAAGDIKGLAQGSIIVLENYLADRSLKSISVMYRSRGFNPQAHDWYWMEFKPDGTVVESVEKESQSKVTQVSTSGAAGKLAATTKIRLAGKTSSCIACHQKASGNDFFYSNDPRNRNATAAAKKVIPATTSPTRLK